MENSILKYLVLLMLKSPLTSALKTKFFFTFCSATSEKSIRICLWFMSKSYEKWRQSEKTCSIYLPQRTTSFLSYLRKTIYRQQICENSCSICSYERKTSFVPFVRVHNMFLRILNPEKNGIIVLTNCEKFFSSDWEKLMKFEAVGREFAKILRSPKQFIQTVKGQKNFW